MLSVRMYENYILSLLLLCTMVVWLCVLAFVEKKLALFQFPPK